MGLNLNKYINIVPFFHNASTTIEQHSSNITDAIGNKLDENNNIIKGATCFASSTLNHQPMYGAHHAFTKTYNYWAPNKGDDKPSITFSKAYYTADGVYHTDNPDYADQIYFRSPNSVNKIKYIKLEASLDNKSWTTLLEITNKVGLYNMSATEGRYDIVYEEGERTKFNYFKFSIGRDKDTIVGLDELSIGKIAASIYEPLFDFNRLINVPESIYIWRAPVSIIDELPVAGIAPGSASYVKSERLIYLFDGTEWYPTGEGSKYWLDPVDTVSMLPKNAEDGMLCFVMDENRIYSVQYKIWEPLTAEIPLVTQEEKGLMSPEDKILVDKVRTTNLLSTTGSFIRIPPIGESSKLVNRVSFPRNVELVLIDEDNIRWNHGKDFVYNAGTFTFLVQAPYEIMAEVHYK